MVHYITPHAHFGLLVPCRQLDLAAPVPLHDDVLGQVALAKVRPGMAAIRRALHELVSRRRA